MVDSEKRLSLPGQRYRSSGFTLVELIVVVIIISVLGAIAVPRYIEMSRDARVASLQTLAGAIQTAAINVHAACALTPTCDTGNAVIGGRPASVQEGWLNSSGNLNNDHIDAWVTHSGFTATLLDPYNTTFTLDGAPDSPNCSVVYGGWPTSYSHTYTIAVITTGC